MSEFRLSDKQLDDLIICAAAVGERGRYLAIEAVHELRARRAADLTWNDKDVLGSLAECYLELRGRHVHDWERRALDVIERLTKEEYP
jgi:hypothetical protein